MNSCKMTCITFLTLVIFVSAVNSDTNTLRKRLPIGLGSVEECNKNNAIYVDKTEFALTLIQSGGRSFLLLRPRRFGKTFFLNTLESIFRGRKDAFKDYFIGNPQSGYGWQAHRVIRLTFCYTDPIKNLADRLAGIAKCNGVDRVLANIPTTSIDYFEKLLRELSPIDENGDLRPGNNAPLALLIDEYDLPFKTSDDGIRKYFYEIFTRLKRLADEKIVQFVFITGCNRVNLLPDYSNTGHSGLSTTLTIEDISLHPQYSAICGFTEKEIETCFHDHMQEAADIHKVTVDVIYKEVENWYDGYRFTPNSPSLYNPISLLYYLRDTHIRKPQNYWIETQSHPRTVMEALIEARLRSKCIILDLEKHYTRNELFQPTENIHSLQQEAGPEINLKQTSFESILFQNGYLTIQEYDCTNNLYTLEVPNMEVMEAFMNGIGLAMEKEDECMTLHREAKSSLQNLNINMFVQTFNISLERYLGLVETNTKEKEGFLKGFLQNLLTLDPVSRNKPTPEWNVGREVWTKKSSGSGEIDFLIETSKYRIIIEGKYEATSNQMEEAHEQAKSYQFPCSESKNNRALVRLVFNFNGNGIFQWIGDEYDADNKFVRMLDQDRNIHCEKKFKCDFPNCNENFHKPKSLSNHKRVHKSLAQGESVE